VLTKLNIDSKKEVMSLQLAEEEVSVRLKELKKFPYEKEAEVKEEKTIEELASIYFNIPLNDLERSLNTDESIPNEEGKKELDDILNNSTEAEDIRDFEYEELMRKGDEVPPPLELKSLPEDLRYEFLDEEKKCPVIINSRLSSIEVRSLLDVLIKHDKVFEYSLKDIKGIYP
jgi:hypothetical protein